MGGLPFEVNKAWIAFRLNDKPFHTERDGDFNFLALMDAASRFILGSVLIASIQLESTQLEAKRPLKEGQAHMRRWPKTLFVPSERTARFLVLEAERHGIGVVRVEENQLLSFIAETQDGFRERIGGGAPSEAQPRHRADMR